MGCFCPANAQNNDFVRTKAGHADLKQVYNMDTNILGKGSFGTVYKGTNRFNKDLRAAIKAIDKRTLSPEEIEDIFKEVQTLQSVDHAHIVNYFETY